jgi:hypothetical protein
MKNLQIALLAVLMGVSGLALAAEPSYDQSREQRMNDALDHYHDNRNPAPGPGARTEESVKGGATRTGHAIKRGAHNAGMAVRRGAHKTSEAIHHVGEKIEGKNKTDQ